MHDTEKNDIISLHVFLRLKIAIYVDNWDLSADYFTKLTEISNIIRGFFYNPRIKNPKTPFRGYFCPWIEFSDFLYRWIIIDRYKKSQTLSI